MTPADRAATKETDPMVELEHTFHCGCVVTYGRRIGWGWAYCDLHGAAYLLKRENERLRAALRVMRAVAISKTIEDYLDGKGD